jgi:hypothetical protein
MAKKRKTKETEKFRLEDYLLLARFIANKLGMKKVADIKDFKDIKEGFDTDGRSYMYYALISRQGNTISEEKLRQYDDNIRKYVERLKQNREENLSLKYYQYLSILFSEIYLDLYFDTPIDFMNELNEWTTSFAIDEAFTLSSMKKIAYWMATGSGKTLIMHINFWQFMVYNQGRKKLDFENIFLITPSEGMTKQHLDELEASGIPAKMFKGESEGYFTTEENKAIIKVIDINKLKLPEDKKGEGVTIDISSLGTRNLVFVDEGHKGHKSEDKKWKQVRDRLSKDGFTFEYSATFGQAINSINDDAFREYAKAILFDYSYKYFYGDGYGKDFYVLNLDTEKFDETRVPVLLLANAMSFYEQILVYKKTGEQLQPYNIEKPLLVFLGSRVNEDESDILEVIKFLNWILTENETEIKSLIRKILKGESGIIDDNKKDVFTPRFPEKNFSYLRQEKLSSEEIYHGLLREIFYVIPGTTGRRLRLINIKNAEGEIGLKAGNSDKFFGVINIGNKSDFLKIAEKECTTVTIETDVTGPSLFDTISHDISVINILIGAKKFIEGWNCWRVSNMGLLNVGKGEGPQIIQLFGRGVRLRGKEFTLKRSNYLQPPHPKYIQVLETLNIFGIKANYMKDFKRIIEREDLPTYQELPLPIKIIEPFPDDLQILRIKKDKSFENEIYFELKLEDILKVKLDLLPRATVIDSRGERLIASTTSEAEQKTIKKEILDILNWKEILFDILKYKNEKGWFNISITEDSLKDVIYHHCYALFCIDEHIDILSFSLLEQAQEIVVRILKKYFDRYYSLNRYSWEKDNLELITLKKEDKNFIQEYQIQVIEDDLKIKKEVDQLVNSEKLYNSKGDHTLSNAYIKNHLYQPLLIKRDDNKIITIPTGLNKGEAKFIDDLDKYITENPKEFQDSEIYLIRNLTRGVGFFERDFFFYPDFIMWMKKKDKQVIKFLDPKGLIFIGDLDHPKLKLHEKLKEIEKQLNNPNIELDAFIISNTPYTDVNKRYEHQASISKQKYEEEKHILFQYLQEGQPDPLYIKYLCTSH